MSFNKKVHDEVREAPAALEDVGNSSAGQQTKAALREGEALIAPITHSVREHFLLSNSHLK